MIATALLVGVLLLVAAPTMLTPEPSRPEHRCRSDQTADGPGAGPWEMRTPEELGLDGAALDAGEEYMNEEIAGSSPRAASSCMSDVRLFSLFLRSYKFRNCKNLSMDRFCNEGGQAKSGPGSIMLNEPITIGERVDLVYAASKFIYASFTIWPFFIAKYGLHLPNLMMQSSTQ